MTKPAQPSETVRNTVHLNHEHLVAQSDVLVRLALEATEVAAIVIDSSGLIVTLTRSAEELLGIGEEMLLGQDMSRILPLSSDPELDNTWQTLDLSEHLPAAEPCEIRKTTLCGTDSDAKGCLLVLRAHSLNYSYSQNVIGVDPLTGLLNRQAFSQQVQRYVAKSRGTGKRFALVYLDLDGFKVVNDSVGTESGDKILKEIAYLLRTAPDESMGAVARLGDDEFGLIVDITDHVDVRASTEGIRELLRSYTFRDGQRRFNFTASVGAVEITSYLGENADPLMLAEAASLAARESGGDQEHVYDFRAFNHASLKKLELEMAACVHKALEDDRFHLFFQPVVCARNIDRIRYLEILLRMNGENGELIGPGSFMAAAEKLGYSTRIDRVVIKKSFALIRDWQEEIQNSTIHNIGINLCGSSLSDPTLFPFICNQAEIFDIKPELICFEITETSAIQNQQVAKDLIVALRNAGYRIALDDFGTGLASFAYLRNFPVDFLKIDGLFVPGIVDNPVDAVMVDAIYRVASCMGLRIIAEYVENEEVLSRLAGGGIHFVQGFAIGKPESVSNIGDWIGNAAFSERIQKCS